VIVEERIETTVPKAKAARPIVEKMITLGKRGDLAARRLATAYLMTDEAVVKLFDTVGPRLATATAGTHASFAPAGIKATAPTKLSSSCLAAKRCWTKAREARRSPRQEGRRNQEGHGRCRGASPATTAAWNR